MLSSQSVVVFTCGDSLSFPSPQNIILKRLAVSMTTMIHRKEEERIII